MYFVTGNPGKFREAKEIIPELKQIELDLTEIQEFDMQKIVKAKLIEASKKVEGEVVVEDTGLFLDCLNGLPGPMIKWFLKRVGNKGLFEICDSLGQYGAKAKTVVGLYDDDFHFYEGCVRGKIVSPRGEGFGWDPVFQPEGYSKTFGEIGFKNDISMRRKAFEKLWTDRDFQDDKSQKGHA